jgi:H/ACA ribonucleoprotein complex subunit 4
MNELPFEKIDRKVLVKKEAETDETKGCFPDSRPVETLIHHGVINLNKPSGPTSHLTTDYVKKILNLKRAGHGGTLDPAVTGVLPIALDRSTRIVQALLPAGKEYICLMHIHKEVPEDKIRKVMDEFLGKITQLPPKKSAVKREKRQRNVYYLDILDIQGKEVLFKMGCQAGTYVRKLCSDFGEKLSIGAHMAQLIRSKAGPFKLENSATLQDLQDAYSFYKEGDEIEIRKVILPIEFAVSHLKKVWIFDSAIPNICNGSELYAAGISKLDDNIEKEELIAMMSLKDELVGLGISKMESEEMLNINQGVAVKTSKVFMERGIY